MGGGVTVDQLILELIWIWDLLIKINKCVCSILHRLGLVDCLDAVRDSAELRKLCNIRRTEFN